MKKSFIVLAALTLGASAYAQDDKVYTPEAEDWSIGIDATPFLNYFGNFIGGNGLNTAPSWNFLTTNQTITGKYFTAADMAYRGSLRLGFSSMSEVNLVDDRVVVDDFPNAPTTVENEMKTSMSNIGLSGGLEWRKGMGRLQGYYGGELGISLSSMKTTYTYGNALTVSTATNPVGVSGDDAFGGGSNITSDPYGNAARVLEDNNGSTFGLRGFIGVEYFILPKLSLGGEFGWGLVFMSTGSSSMTTESVGFNPSGTESVEQITTETGGSSSFGIDTDANNTVFGPAGSLRLSFYF